MFEQASAVIRNLIKGLGVISIKKLQIMSIFQFSIIFILFWKRNLEAWNAIFSTYKEGKNNYFS